MSRDSRKSRSRPCGSSAAGAAVQMLLTLLVASLLVAGCAAEPLLAQVPLRKPSTEPDVHDFILYRGVYDFPQLQARIDIPNNPELVITENGPAPAPRLVARSKAVRVQRLANRSPKYVESIVTSNRLGGFQALDASAWVEDDTHGPDVADRETLITLAMIAENAYYIDEKDPEWEKLGGGYNRSLDFGWEGDSLRGHIYADETNSTIVLGLKGTSVAVFDGPETTTNDKINDNLFFGCCCGAQSSLTKKVCDCQQATNTCGTTCLKRALMDESRYYTVAKELYSNVTEIYPDAEIWIVGHSLGGSVSALLGHTFGRPVVTFQAPAEALAASRIGIPAPPGADPTRPQTWGTKHIHHFGNNADPIFMGACNGVTSSCQYAGYAMESVCHGGLTCIFNMTGKGWTTSVAYHRIRNLIDSVMRKYNDTVNCTVAEECFDCPLWKFVEGNGTSSTTTSKPTTTYTSRTTTCKTPGWWGCLDDSTTTTTTSDSGTSTSTDVITITTTTTTTTTSTSITTTTSTCKTPGWFGCKDKTTDAPTPSITQPPETTSADVSTTSDAETSTHSCETPGYVWGCRDKMTTTTSTSTSATTTTTTTTRVVNPTSASATACQTPGWFGLICRDPVQRAPRMDDWKGI